MSYAFQLVASFYFVYSGIKIIRSKAIFAGVLMETALQRYAGAMTLLGGGALTLGGSFFAFPAFDWFGAVLICSFLLVATLVVHPPWKAEELSTALTNLALAALVASLAAA